MNLERLVVLPPAARRELICSEGRRDGEGKKWMWPRECWQSLDWVVQEDNSFLSFLGTRARELSHLGLGHFYLNFYHLKWERVNKWKACNSPTPSSEFLFTLPQFLLLHCFGSHGWNSSQTSSRPLEIRRICPKSSPFIIPQMLAFHRVVDWSTI